MAWVNAGGSRSLLAGLAAVADAAGLSDGGSRDPGQAVRHRLEVDGERCLLVLHDVEDPDVVRPIIPVGGAARVLITTTRQPVAGLGTSIPVDVFSADEALEFLDERTGLGDEAGAAAVAAELGYLPLALSQAAAVMAAQQLGYETYLERLRPLPVEEPLTCEQEQPYPRGVMEAVLLSLNALQASDETGACSALMEIVAVLSTAGVRRELLHAAGQAGALARGAQQMAPAAVDRTLERLVGRSLLTFSLDGQTVIAHRLVTQVVREKMIRRGRLTAVCRAAALVLQACADALAASPDRPAVRDFLEQVMTLLESVSQTAAETDKELARLLLRLRFLALYHLIELGDSAFQAITVGESLTADLERMLGPDHPDTLNSRNSLAAAYLAAGRAADAIPLFERTLVGREQVLGPDHPDTLNSQNNLAATYQDAGRIGEAILMFELTLGARQRLLGTDHPSTVNSRGNLASAYLDAGRLAEAIPLFEQTLAARERAMGSHHPDTQRSRDKLASAYRAAGRISEAIPLIEQMLAAREWMLGASHPRTLASRNNLAVAYRETGRNAEAIPLFEQNLAACERLLGADHPRTRATRNNLALAYQDAAPAK